MFITNNGCCGCSRDRNAERYSLLRKLTITEPDNHTLELNFTAPDKQVCHLFQCDSLTRALCVDPMFVVFTAQDVTCSSLLLCIDL